MVKSNETSLDAVFHALADATRRNILLQVRTGSKPVSVLAEPHAMSLAAVSKHLDVLERSSLIRRERHGKQRLVSLNPGPLQAAQDWLAFYQLFWSDRLDGLQAHLESLPEQEL